MERFIEQVLPFHNSSYTHSQTQQSITCSQGNNRKGVGTRGVTIALLSLVLIGISLTPNTLWAGTITAASCSRNDVGSAVDRASNGDTVLIPEGNCTWTTNLTINGKYLTLQGAGADVTIIKDGVSKNVFPNIPQVLVWSTIDGGLSRLTGITFHGGTITDSYNKGIIQIDGTSHRFRVDHCKFIPTQTASLFAKGELWGVVDHNVFDLSALHGYAIYVMGGFYGDMAWAESSTLGTDRNVFVEDNVFTNNQSVGPHYYAVDGWSGSRVVIRHNQFNAVTMGNHGTESPGRLRSQRSWEIYNNTFTWNMLGSAFSSLIIIRGGTGVIYNNSAIISNGTLNRFMDYNYFRSTKSYSPWGQCPSSWDLSVTRCLDQTGVGEGMRISGDTPSPVDWPNQVSDPAYDWNNLVNGAISKAVSNTPTVVQENRDFFHQPKSGYTPYSYPHPLVTSSGTTDPSPAPPQNLSVK